MRIQYKVCPYCGSNLDPDERCNCREEQEGKTVEEAGRSAGEMATVDWLTPILMPGA